MAHKRLVTYRGGTRPSRNTTVQFPSIV